MNLPQANSFDKISPTALLAAYARQFTDIPYSKELAQLVDAQTVVQQLLGKKSEKLVEAAIRVESRYKAINQLMAQWGATQVIELASGLLPRGMAMSCYPNVTFVESDLPAMISRKQQLVKQLIGERPNLHFTAIDAANRPSQFPLHADYLYQDKPVMVLCEGLLQYLTFAEKQQVFANVREMLQVYGGAWITPDLTTKEGWIRQGQVSPGFQELSQTVKTLTDRTIGDYDFDNLDHVKQFANEQGFRVEEYSMSGLNVMAQLTCLEVSEIHTHVAESILANQSIFTLSIS